MDFFLWDFSIFSLLQKVRFPLAMRKISRFKTKSRAKLDMSHSSVRPGLRIHLFTAPCARIFWKKKYREIFDVEKMQKINVKVENFRRFLYRNAILTEMLNFSWFYRLSHEISQNWSMVMPIFWPFESEAWTNYLKFVSFLPFYENPVSINVIIFIKSSHN